MDTARPSGTSSAYPARNGEPAVQRRVLRGHRITIGPVLENGPADRRPELADFNPDADRARSLVTHRQLIHLGLPGAVKRSSQDHRSRAQAPAVRQLHGGEHVEPGCGFCEPASPSTATTVSRARRAVPPSDADGAVVSGTDWPITGVEAIRQVAAASRQARRCKPVEPGADATNRGPLMAWVPAPAMSRSRSWRRPLEW